MSKVSKPVQFAEGVTLIDDVLAEPGVETLEGRVGTLIFGDTIRTHYIDMPARSYVDEHPHDDEALTYTVRGKWVLVAGGKRRLMGPGSLYWFGPDVPTGYEVPFDEDAFLLVFRGVVGESAEEMVAWAEEKLKPHLVEEQEKGTAFMLADLPQGHPALAFAHKVNPQLY